jgi:hypothetical protein
MEIGKTIRHSADRIRSMSSRKSVQIHIKNASLHFVAVNNRWFYRCFPKVSILAEKNNIQISISLTYVKGAIPWDSNNWRLPPYFL